MANSKNSIFGQSLAPDTRNPGSLGTNGDAADPDSPTWLVGDTSGSLGIQDHGDPDSPMSRLRGTHRSGVTVERLRRQEGALESTPQPIPQYLQKYFARVQDPTETWVAQQKLSKAEAQELIQEIEQRLTLFATEEAALVTEIEKVRKDLEVYGKIQIWYESASDKNEVLVTDVKTKFNDQRWGGKGVKIGGIDTASQGEPVISDEFRKSNPEVIVQGIVLHEQVHKKDFNDMSTGGAFFNSLGNPLKGRKLFGQTWAAGQEDCDGIESAPGPIGVLRVLSGQPEE